MREPVARFTGAVVMTLAGITFVSAALCMVKRLEPFHTWYFVFSWWSYIFFLEGFLHWRGARSSLFDSTTRFVLQLPLSVTIWSTFEVFNFRLQNWHYVQVPPGLPLRWMGYAVSYATVLPGLEATTGVIKHLGIFQSVRWPPLLLRRDTSRLIVGIGVVSLILPWLLPQYFFPLVWLGFILVLGPLSLCGDHGDLLRGLQSGKPRRLLELLLSGLMCGFLWEFWNHWAGAKWVYTVPFAGWLKVFEMPILGFLGFPPFAVECYLMSGCAFHLWEKMGGDQSPGTGWKRRVLLSLVLLVFWALVFAGIDRYTVISFGA